MENQNESIPQSTHKKSYLPIILIIFGITGIIVSLLLSYGSLQTINQLATLYSDLNIKIPNPYLSFYFWSIISLIIPIASIYYGLKLKHIQNTSEIPRRQKTIAILLILSPFIFLLLSIPFYILSVITPIYNLVGEIENSQTIIPSPATSPAPNGDRANWKTYKSKNNKYTFDYPSDLSLEVSSSVYLKKGPESNLSLLIEIAPETKYVSEKEKSFRDWAVGQFQARCRADGPNSSIYCDKVAKEVSFTNKYGLKIYELYLNQIHEVNNNQSSQTIGPMFAIDISEKTNSSTYGLLIIPSYGFPDKNEEEVVRKIIDTIRFTD